MLPWGGPREVFLAIQDGQIDHALALLHNAIGEHVELLESKVAMEAGLFGSLTGKYPGLESRIGDIVVLPKDHKTVWYHHPGQEPFNLRGHHGGLSNDELQVPFALLRSK